MVAVPIAYQLKYPSAELTEFAIVTLWRTTGGSSVHVHDTGQREVVPSSLASRRTGLAARHR